MITFVCGLSKSGKSTLIDQARSEGIVADHIKASAVLRDLGRPTLEARASDVIANQELLVDWLDRSIRCNPRRVILDGHFLIESLDGPQLVPDSVLKSLPVTKVICVHCEPKLIADRRAGSRFTQSLEEIEDLMAIEERQAARFARQIGAPISTVSATDVIGFREAAGTL